MTPFQADQAAIEEIRRMGGRVVHRRVQTGDRYLHDGEVHTWALNAPSRFELPVLEPIDPDLHPGPCFFCDERDTTPDHFDEYDMCKKRGLLPPAKKQLLVIAFEICEHPEDIKTQITPALAEALVTPAYAQGVIEAGYVARIVDAPDA